MGLTILVVDDSKAVHDRVQHALGCEDYRLLAAEDANAAVRILHSERVELVLCDIVMPGMDGLKFLALVKRNERFKHIPVIMLTSQGDVSAKVTALEAGAADYLVKPFDDDELLARTRAHLKLKSLQDQLRDKNVALKEMASRDSLTGLFNHAYFQDRVQAEVGRSERSNHELSVAFIDIDHFKEINDKLGHQAGDALLRDIAGILDGKGKRASRAFRIRRHDVVARYGGDEFVIMFPETTKAGAATKAEQLRQHVEQISFDDLAGGVTLSIGVATFPRDARTRALLIAAADTALYAAKRNGRNGVVSYTDDLAKPSKIGVEGAVSEVQLAALHRSMDERKFAFVNQPIVDAESGEIFGYEALCRPTDSAFAGPLELIGAAERTGKIVPLGRMLREMAVAAMPSMRDGRLLFINLHPFELYDPALVAPEDFMKPWVNRVVLEITELAAIKDYTRVGRIISRLKKLGFRIAVDDLASGYAGLHALAQIDADFVKLDRSLVSNVDRDNRTARLVKHLLHYAQEEDIRVVAEGIETAQEAEAIRALGCPLLQGFYLAKPRLGFDEL